MSSPESSPTSVPLSRSPSPAGTTPAAAAAPSGSAVSSSNTATPSPTKLFQSLQTVRSTDLPDPIGPADCSIVRSFDFFPWSGGDPSCCPGLSRQEVQCRGDRVTYLQITSAEARAEFPTRVGELSELTEL
ncbi:hypothetical protein BCR44DRAFT_37607 [Catenaria anguillulae PL171]|uniref:Uncharacterized protein n=1 Tax=Catenaria anguillulae PL171 TaxID=765915 RepID=A0A1Y2HV95_9FUNG|nr:hypothetical protein BCR44DRAFT_37607 [Catenaria anguillulae PL171]